MILNGVSSSDPAPTASRTPRMETAGHGRMKDRRYHRVSPWLVLPLVTLTIASGLWLSVGNRVSGREAVPASWGNVPVGLDQVSPQGPFLEPTTNTHPGVQGTALLEWGSAELQPPVNRDPAATRSTPSPPETPPSRLAIESDPPRPLHRPESARSWHMELMAREADSHTRRGFDLAGRGAVYSARAEFIIALRLIAQARDEDRGNTECGGALSAGLTALSEAGDFLPFGASMGADLDLADIIRTHYTPVLRDAALDNLTAHATIQCYFSFAQEQLAASAGSEVSGSMALYALGRLHGSMAEQRGSRIRAALPKAVAFHQASLLVMPRNHLASNDLGVLLARGGRQEDARIVMERGLAVHPSSVGWRNLGLVLWQLGRTGSSRQAHQHYLTCLESDGQDVRHGSGSSGNPVRWVDPGSFARLGATLRNAKREERPSPQPPRQVCRPPQRHSTRHGPLLEATPEILLCQALGPAAPCNICGVDCSECDGCQSRGWEAMRAIAWQAYAQGEYVGHERLAHVDQYRLRVDDELALVYRLTRDDQQEPYKLNVGDEIRVESFTDEALTRDLLIQPDGTITLRLLGQVRATGRTVAQLTKDLEALYQEFYNVPAITVTPLTVNTKLNDLIAAVDRRQGFGGQSQDVKVTPEGTISLPAIGHVKAHGLTLGELQRELNERYRAEVNGIEVIPALVQRAPRYVYVLGEVAAPGRFELTGPTTVLQSLAMAGSWNNGAHLKQIVVFRRGDDWRLLATMIDLRATLHGKQPCPAGEIWLSDSDVVIVPKNPILVADDFIDLVFTRGIYGVFPMNASMDLTSMSSL